MLDASTRSEIDMAAAIEFLAAVRSHVCVVTRLRLDAFIRFGQLISLPAMRTPVGMRRAAGPIG
jgi:hypothetical protein